MVWSVVNNGSQNFGNPFMWFPVCLCTVDGAGERKIASQSGPILWVINPLVHPF